MKKAILFLSFVFATQARSQNIDSAIDKWNSTAECHSQLNRISLEISVTCNNIANVSSTRTPEGGPYAPKRVVCDWKGCEIEKIQRGPKLVYQPDHPDANEEGYVSYPNIDLMEEMSIVTKDVKEYEETIKRCFQR